MNMNIRVATPEDKPAMIELLKKSLGESIIPKSEAFWCWKHERNPFGQSYVLLAEEGEQLIGLRAFMQWKWQWKGETYNAIRAVDTATHPDHQGKGIFKKLTLQQAEACKKQGVHFVFNTPNEQSRPGYLKMGWVAQGKMPLKLKVVQPVSLLYSKFFQKKHAAIPADDTIPAQEWKQDVFELLKKYVQNEQQLTTALSPEYIIWRYAENPLFKYHYLTDHENFLLVSRIKTHSFTKELRIVDFILINPGANAKKINAFIRKSVVQFCKTHGISFVSLSGQQYQSYKKYFDWMGIVPVQSLGPIVTLKDLNMNGHFQDLLNVKNWGYSLGDMELF